MTSRLPSISALHKQPEICGFCPGGWTDRDGGGVHKNAILQQHILTPADLDAEYGMTGGNIFHGEMSLGQLFFLRPVAGWARYRTPIRNLYQYGRGPTQVAASRPPRDATPSARSSPTGAGVGCVDGLQSRLSSIRKYVRHSGRPALLPVGDVHVHRVESDFSRPQAY